MRQIRQHVDRPVLITDARQSGDEEFDHRRKRYLIMMALRALCILGAASTFRFSGWLAAAFVVGGLVLPWTAVLIANDRPPKESVRFRRFFNGHPGDLNGHPGDLRFERELPSPGPPSEDAGRGPSADAHRGRGSGSATPTGPSGKGGETVIDI